MNQRNRNAMQAAIAAALIAAMVSAVLLLVTGKAGDIVYLAPGALIAAFLTTLLIWRLAFKSARHGVRRALWVGALIPVISMFVLWAGAGLIMTGQLQHLLTGSFIAIFGLMLFGPVLAPVRALCAAVLRRMQLNRAIDADEKPDRPEKPARRQSTPRRWPPVLKYSLFGLAAIAVLGLGAAIWLALQIFDGGNINLSSRSPSGKYVFQTREGCFGNGCWHEGQITIRQGPDKGYSISCNLQIIADFPHFTQGASLSWNDEESIIRWRSADGAKGQVELSQACGQLVPVHAPSRQRNLFIKENCLHRPCQRTFSLRVELNDRRGSTDTHLCRLTPAEANNLMAARPASAKFSWSADERRLSWQSKQKTLSGSLDLHRACTAQ